MCQKDLLKEEVPLKEGEKLQAYLKGISISNSFSPSRKGQEEIGKIGSMKEDLREGGRKFEGVDSVEEIKGMVKVEGKDIEVNCCFEHGVKTFQLVMMFAI